MDNYPPNVLSIFYHLYKSLASYSKDNGLEFIWNSLNKVKKITPEVESQLQRLVNINVSDANSTISYFKLSDKSVQGFTKSLAESGTVYKSSEEAMVGYQSYLKSTSGALSLADIKTKALSASMKVLSTIGWMAVFAGASALIGKVVGSIDNYIHRNEIAISKADDLKSALDSSISTINDHKKSLDSLNDRFMELSKGVDEYGNNVSLTKDQMEEYNGLVGELIGINPALVEGYNSENEAIINKNTALAETVDLLKRERELELQKATSSNNLKTVGEGAVAKKTELEGTDFTGQIADYNLETVSGQAARFGTEAGKIFSSESIKAFYDYTNSRPSEKMYGKSDWLKSFGFEVPDDKVDLDIDAFLQGNVGVFSQNMNEILSKANIDPNSDQAKNLKLYIQEWQTLNKELESIDASYIDGYLQKIPQLKDGYDSLSDSQKSFISGYIREGFNAFDLQNGSVDVKSSIENMVESISSDNKVKNAINDLFTLSTKDMNVTDYVDQYKTMLENIIAQLNLSDTDANRLRLKFSVDADDLSSKYNNAIKFAQNKFDGYDPTKFFNSNSINSQEEIDNWLKIAQATNSAREAERLYLEQSKKSVPVSSKEEVIANVNSLSEGFESLDKIMSSMKDKNPFDFSLLDDKKFKDSFNGLGETYTNFIETVSSSPKDIKGAQSAFNDLTTAWIDSKLALTGYTEENANLIASMLKNMGIANAEEVVASRLAFAQEHLAAQKAYTAEKSDQLSNAMANEIPGLIEEATQSDIAKVALAGLALEKANANGTILDTSGDIENAIALINTIGSATSALVAYNKAKAGDIFDPNTQKANLNNLLSQRTGLGISMELDNQLNVYQDKMDSLKSAVDKEVQDAINTSKNYQGKGANANYNGANKSNKAGSDKKKKDETKNEIDWIARGTKVLQDEYAKLEELANKNTVAYLGLTQDQFDNAKSIFDNGLGNTTEGLSELQSYADKAGLSLGELYTMIQSGAPGSSKENALQGMLKMQTETLLPQYQQEVDAYAKAYSDALKAVPEYKDKIENGGVEIESLPSDLAKKVQTAIDANEKLKSSEKQLEEGREKQIQTIKELHENRISAIDIENEKLEQSNKIIKSQMDLIEARGEIIDADFYQRQKNNNKDLISGNQQNIAEWESEMADLRAAKVSVKSKDYKELQAKIKSAKNEIQTTKLEQEELNKALEQIPIDNLNTIVSMYKDISSAIEKWGDVASATGGKLNADYYQTLISNGATTIDQYQKLASEIENVMDEQKEGSTRWNELYGQLQSVNSEMSSMVQNLKKWNEELLKMPLENINNYTSELQKVADGLSGVKSEYDTAISAVTGAIGEQIKAINEQKDAVNEEYDAQKKASQDKLDLLNKQNKELQLQQKYEQALYNLQKANQQATEKVIRDGQVVYEQNADKLRDAQDAVQDAKFDMETDKIQTQIDELQETLDGLNEKYQDQIDSLQKISDKWSEISEKITQAQNEAKAEELLGVGWKDKVLSGKDIELFNNFSGMYANTSEQLRQYQEQINSTNNIYSLLEDYITSYKEGTLSYDQALTGINNLLAQMNQTMSAEGNIQNIYDYLGAMNGTAANAENVLAGIKQGLANTATELIDSFKQYNQNAGLISEYTSSWQQLTDNVSSMLRVLEEVRDNLESASDDDDEDDEDSDGPSHTGSSGYVNSGPGAKSKSDDPIWDLIDDKKATSRKDGITRGLVGSSSGSDKEAKLKLLGLKNMNQDEISAVLHKNEAVFNPEQQDMLLKNLVTAWNFAPSKIDYSSLSSNRSNLTTQEFKFGNINIQECNNTEELAQGILNGGLKRAIIQQSGKR